MNLRLAKVPGGARYYVHDEAGHLIGEYDAAGLPVYEVVYAGELPVAVLTQVRGGTAGAPSVQTQLSYIYADHLATPRVIVRAADQVIQWRWDQAEAYGLTPPNADPSGLGPFSFNLRFPGQVYDAESGLVYNHHRDYDAAVGRYVQSDPIGLGGGINTYAYVGGNPLRYVDPPGRNAALGAELGAEGGFVIAGPPGRWLVQSSVVSVAISSRTSLAI